MSKEQTRKADYFTVFSYTNYARLIYQGLMLAITKFPSLIVAVFLRKNFGERYFTLSASITLSVLLLLPYFAARELSHSFEVFEIMNFTWVIFILIFLGFSIKRRLEFDRKSRTISTERFSYFEGEINDDLWEWIEGKTKIIKADYYLIQRYWEPLLVFIVGFVLTLTYIFSFIGMFLTALSILQYIRVSILYARGRHYLMDKIDAQIAKENLRNTIVFDKPASQTQGFSIFGPRPESQEVREKIVDQIFEKEKEEEVVTI